MFPGREKSAPVDMLLLGFVSNNNINFQSTEEGAQTLLHLACDKSINRETGQYFVDCIRFIQPFQTYNKKLCKEIWDKSREYVKLRPDEILI